MVLQSLLIRAGIEQNPGPVRKQWPAGKWICSICKADILRPPCVQCNSCKQWIHLNCSTLSRISEHNRSFTGSCCNRNPAAPPVAQQQPPSTHPQQLSQQLSTSPYDAPLKILQYNCNGLRGNIHDILRFMEKHNILIAAIQETKMTVRANITTLNHSLVRLDRERGGIGGGLAFLIHKSIQYSIVTLPPPTNVSPPIEQQAISITSGTNTITLVNIYIPPVSSCPNASFTNIEHILEEGHSIIMGDFNGHHPLWNSALPVDARGTELANQISDSDYEVMNDEAPTRIVGDTISSPDFTLVHPSILHTTTWTVLTSMCSDQFTHRDRATKASCKDQRHQKKLHQLLQGRLGRFHQVPRRANYQCSSS